MSRINWNRRNYTEQQFIECWNSSCTVAECARKLGIGPTSPTTSKTAKLLGLTTEHMIGRAYASIRPPVPARPLDTVLTYGREEKSTHLKGRLLAEGLLDRKCYNCGNEEWMGGQIPLELDHINGDRLDNRRENLTLLCPNCHALTPTYRGKNQASYRMKLERGVSPRSYTPQKG